MTGLCSAAAGLRRVFVRGLAVQARLGVHPHEQIAAQRVVIDIELAVLDDAAPDQVGPDRLGRVVDYAAIADLARRIAGSGHIKLVETLAERIAIDCLAERRVQLARVTVEKPDAFADVEAVGVTVERRRG